MQTPPPEATATKTTADPSDTLRLPKVRQRAGRGRSTIYRLIAQGRFPSFVQLSPRAVGWRKADVDAWLESRLKTSS